MEFNASILAEKSLVAFNANWSPANKTEQHAFEKMHALMPIASSNLVYFGFPWATLIDSLSNNEAESEVLLEALNSFKAALLGRAVITVCQHPEMLNYQHLFKSLEIKHVFWPYALKGQAVFPEYNHISIHAFPLFPATYNNPSDNMLNECTQCQFSYEEVVLGTVLQVDNVKKMPLWESINNTIIPIVSPANQLLPGNCDLWDNAIVSYSNSQNSFNALPNMLNEIACNQDLTNKKTIAIKQLQMLYGPECFVYDILTLFLTSSGEKKEPFFLCLHQLALGVSEQELDLFVLACVSRAFVNKEQFIAEVKSSHKTQTLLFGYLKTHKKHVNVFNNMLNVQKITLSCLITQDKL